MDYGSGMTNAGESPWLRLRQLRRSGTVVVAHRGDSCHHTENTLTAFRAAAQLGVAMQEFDVHATRDHQLVCLHDETLDRTTDAARRLGPGALVAQLRQAELAGLRTPAGDHVPSLPEALATMLPACIPLIERKAGAVGTYLETLAANHAIDHCILQSFDWEFLAAAHRQAPSLAIAALGPTAQFGRMDEACIAAARQLGAGMLHWDATTITAVEVQRAQAAGLLVCTYTTDSESGMLGLMAMGVDAFCTNDPGLGLRLQRLGSRARP
jgi:glycerophosphoryl diester phosphodiesterase